MSKDMKRAMMLGGLVVAAGWWWLSRTKPSGGSAVYRDGVWYPPSQSPDVVLNPKRPETYYI